MSTFTFKLAHHVRKRDVVLFRKKVCRVLDNVISAPAKHGHAKCAIMVEDVLTGNRFDEKLNGDKRVKLPETKQMTYELMDMDGEGYLSVFEPNTGDVRNDIRVHPTHNAAMFKRIQNALVDIEENDDVDAYGVVVFSASEFELEFVQDIKPIA